MLILAEKVGNKLIFDASQSVAQDTNGGMLQIAIDEVSDFYYRLELNCPCGVTYRSEAVKRNSSGFVVFSLDRSVTRNAGYVYVQLTYWLVNEDESARSGDMRTTIDSASCFRVTPSVRETSPAAAGESLYDKVSAALKSVADLREKLESDAANGVFDGQNAVVLEEYGNSAESTLSQNFLTLKLTAIEEALISLRSSIASIAADVNVSNDERINTLEGLCAELSAVQKAADKSIGENAAGVSANARAVEGLKNEVAATVASVNAFVTEIRAAVASAEVKAEECVAACDAVTRTAADLTRTSEAIESRLVEAESAINSAEAKVDANSERLTVMSGELTAIDAKVTELGNTQTEKLGIVQELGDSAVTAMSQRAVTQALAEKVSAAGEKQFAVSNIINVDSSFDGTAAVVSLKGAADGGGGSMETPIDFRKTGCDFTVTCAKANILGDSVALSDTINGVTVVKEEGGRFVFSIKGTPSMPALFEMPLERPIALFKDVPYHFAATCEGTVTKAIRVFFYTVGDEPITHFSIGFTHDLTPTEDVLITKICLEVSPSENNDGSLLITADMNGMTDASKRSAARWDVLLRDTGGAPIELYSFDDEVDEVTARDGKYYAVKRIGAITFNGSERWNALKLPRGNAFACSFPGFKRGERDVKCNVFPSAGKQLSDAAVNSCWVQGTANAIFVVATDYTAAHTLDDWKAYLSSHSVTILLKYETPLEIELSEASARSLSEIPLTKGVNAVFADCCPRVAFGIKAFAEASGERKKVFLKDAADTLLIPANTADNVFLADGRSLQFHIDAIYSKLAESKV